MFEKRNCVKSIRSLIICLGIVLSIGKAAFSWFAKYTVYNNPSLSFDEEKIIFESHHYMEGAGGEVGSPGVMMVNVDGSDLTSITRSVERRSEERRVGKECRSRWSP